MQHYLTHSISGQASQPSTPLTCEQAMWSFTNDVISNGRKSNSGFLEGADGITKI